MVRANHARKRPGLRLRVERLAPYAIPALIVLLVDVLVIVKLVENALDGSLVIVIGSPDEPVVPYVQDPPQILDLGDNPVDEFLRLKSVGLRFSLDLQTVFVGSGKEKHLVPP